MKIVAFIDLKNVNSHNETMKYNDNNVRIGVSKIFDVCKYRMEGIEKIVFQA